MKLHWLQHVPFEDLGCIAEWASRQGAHVSCSRLFAGEELPDPEDFDLLVIMGGPMGIHDHELHPWLIKEKAFIQSCIHAGRRILGICLGAQLIADVLGAKVFHNPHKEIGWFPIQRATGVPECIPDNITVFHWHGDTFEIPEGAVRLASSEACANQGFIFRDHVIGLQFHLECTAAGMEALIGNCADELQEAPFIQNAGQMRSGSIRIPEINTVMAGLLNWLIQAG